jgi:hypothetical protein
MMKYNYTSHIHINTESTFTLHKQHIKTKHFFLIHVLLNTVNCIGLYTSFASVILR